MFCPFTVSLRVSFGMICNPSTHDHCPDYLFFSADGQSFDIFVAGSAIFIVDDHCHTSWQGMTTTGDALKENNHFHMRVFI